MKQLIKPSFNTKEVLLDCAESYRKGNPIKEKIITQADYIKAKSVKYDKIAQEGEWERFKKHTSVNNSLSKEDMKSIYENKFVKVQSIRQKYYDKILILADNGRCPICGIGTVSNLDHYLAKSLYPTYSVTPVNLIPVCRDCNFNKKDKAINSNSEAPLNPYYDEVDKIKWLKAEIDIYDTIIVKYYVDSELNTYDSILYRRMLTHISIYKLDSVFSTQASCDIEENKFLWRKIENSNELRAYFLELLTSYEAIQVNTWKTALYRALIKNIDGVYKYLHSKT